MDDETILWEGGPSFVKDAGYFLVCGLLCFLVVPVLMLLWRCLETRAERYELTSERVRVVRGVLTQRLDELELYRVKDTSLSKPLLLRVFGLGNLEITSSDASTPRLVLEAIPQPELVREHVRNRVEKLRTAKGVQQMEHS